MVRFRYAKGELSGTKVHGQSLEALCWLSAKEHRDGISVEDGPARLLEHPFRQAAVGLDPHHVDMIAVADGVPGWAAVEHVDVFQDGVLAEELESVVKVRGSDRSALRLDQAA